MHDAHDALLHGAVRIHDRMLLTDGTWLQLIRGAEGDGDDEPVSDRQARLDAITAELDGGELNAEQLETLETELVAMFRAAAGEGGRAAAEDGERIAEVLTRVRERGTELADERAETDERFREIAEANGIPLTDENGDDTDATDDDAASDDADDDSADDDADETADDATDETAVPVVAGAGRGRGRGRGQASSRGLPRRPGARAAVRPSTQLQSTRVEVHGQRTAPRTAGDLLMALYDASRSLGSVRERGVERNIPVVSATWEHPADQRITGTASENAETMDRWLSYSALSQPAVVAAGGICAPLAVDYDLPILGTDERPVRDAMPSFQADRGGVRWIPSPVLSADVPADAWGVWTTTEDEDPDPTPKVCAVLECDDETSIELEALYRCLEMSNFQNRYSRDRADAIMQLIRTGFARFAETRMLGVIAAGSTAITYSHELGAVRAYLEMLSLANVRYRRRHRIPRGVNLVHLFPDWLYDLLRTDIANAMPGGAVDDNLAVTDQRIDGWFRSRNIRPVPFLDGENAEQTMADAVAAGVLVDWPFRTVSYLYAEGTWVNADGAQMDLGVVRDSTLNAVNRVRLFQEDFEVLFKRGVESWRLAATICPNGAVAGTVEPDACATS